MSEKSYGEQVVEWQRSLRSQELASMVMDYKHGMRSQSEIDAVFEYVRRNPSKRHQFPEIFGHRKPLPKAVKKRPSTSTMSDDPILV